MNILKNFWTWMVATLTFKKNEAVEAASEKVEAAKTTVEHAGAAVLDTVETPYKAVKDYVRDNQGRFAAKIQEIKDASQAAADTAVQELNVQEQKDVTGSGPHGSWNEGNPNG
jgi:uncharacterized phage infection (PIP) family protein YhgE